MKPPVQLKHEWRLRNDLECHGDLVSRLMMRIAEVVTWLIGVINLLTKSA